MVKEIDLYKFPMCLHPLGAGLHQAGVMPGNISIVLPFNDWWRLQCLVERMFPGVSMRFDGRGELPTQFQFYGFRFIAAGSPADPLLEKS